MVDDDRDTAVGNHKTHVGLQGFERIERRCVRCGTPYVSYCHPNDTQCTVNRYCADCFLEVNDEYEPYVVEENGRQFKQCDGEATDVIIC